MKGVAVSKPQKGHGFTVRGLKAEADPAHSASAGNVPIAASVSTLLSLAGEAPRVLVLGHRQVLGGRQFCKNGIRQ